MPTYSQLPGAQTLAAGDLLAVDQATNSGGRVTGQVTAAQLAAALLVLAANALPTTPGAPGSGVVWNNGGVLCVS